MDSNQENAMIILKAMVEGSRRRGNGDVIRKITDLGCDDVNNAIPCLEKMHLVKALPSVNKVLYDFFYVTLEPEGYQYYHENFGKIESI